MTPRRRNAAAGLVALGAVLCGCTTVHVSAGPDAIRVERHFGVLQIRVVDPSHAYVAEVSGLGLVDTPVGFTAGYARHAWVRGHADDCRVVLWIESAADLKGVDNLLKQHPDLCAVPPPTHREGASP